jgi:ribosomal protein L40E
MNVAQLNKALTNLINKAKLAENHDNIDDAIDGWVKVSELALRASKNPNFSTSYRRMLMNRTEGILQHIKELKQIKNQPKRKKLRMEKPEIDEETRVKMDKALSEPLPKTPKRRPEESSEQRSQEPHDIKREKQKQNDQMTMKKPKKSKKLDNSHKDDSWDLEFKDIPEGFREINTSENFEVLTPFDEDSVKKRLSEDVDMNAIRPQTKGEPDKKKSISEKNEDIKLEKKDQDGNVICFACGQANPPDAKKCRNCGTELK